MDNKALIRRFYGAVEITGVNIDHVAEGKIVSQGGAANTFEALRARHMIGPTPEST